MPLCLGHVKNLWGESGLDHVLSKRVALTPAVKERT